MASQETRQRKGGAMAPKSGELGLAPVANMGSAIALATTKPQAMSSVSGRTLRPAVIKEAKVKRSKYGTGPFDEHWLNLDCCGLFCASLTYMLHAYGVYAVCLILIPPWMSTVGDDGIRTISLAGNFHRTAFTLVAALAVYAHFKAMTTNPGAVPPDAIPLEEMKDLLATPTKPNNTNNPNNDTLNGEQTSSLMVEDPPAPTPRKGRRLCRRCNSFKPKRAHHCSICKRCIIKMDHHCPWVNNCVGIGNHKYFLLFIFYTCISCVYSLTLLTTRFFNCLGHHHIRSHHFTCLDRPTQMLSILGLFIEAILFGLFTSCMMFDQSGVVMSNITNIDRLKGGSEDANSKLAGVIEVFGLNPKKGLDMRGGFRADWLSPFHRICFPTTVHDEIMGFCKPCTTRMRDTDAETEMSPMMRGVANIV